MKKIFLTMVAAAALCACTNDDVVSSTATADDVDAVYVKFGLSLANITRSETDTNEGADYGTSSSGQEYGQDYENAVSSVSVVLVQEGTTIVAATEYDPQAVGTDTYVVSFEKKEIKAYAGQEVDVYIYCNQSVSEFDGEQYYSLRAATDDRYWTNNGFYMTNASAHSAQLPEDLAPYNTVANPVDLGVVKVERSMARFDYADGAHDSATQSPYTYPICYDESKALLASLVLREAAVINLSSSFYTFRHMAPNVNQSGTNYADLSATELLTTEYANNWVVDVDASLKWGYEAASSNVSLYYNLDYPSQWQWDDLQALSQDDDDDTWNTGGSNTKDYKIWRYVTENTIPSVDDQKHGITTGICFKTELVDETSGQTFNLGGGNGGRVYVYEEQLYASWDDVVEAAEAAGENTTLHDAYLEVLDAVEAGQTFDEYDEAVTAAMAAAGFTGYSPVLGDDGKYHYYVYYYYWNRHNDNSTETMGIMEFGVVRNNVYKLSVTDITGYGHPAPSSDQEPGTDPDPDPIDPDDPDETDDIYIKVDVEILPWVVRENDITFN